VPCETHSSPLIYSVVSKRSVTFRKFKHSSSKHLYYVSQILKVSIVQSHSRKIKYVTVRVTVFHSQNLFCNSVFKLIFHVLEYCSI
jgi:hypothetical protein